LLEIYSSINNLSISESEKEFSNSQYGEFKIAVGESVVNFLNPIQENFNEYSDEKVLDILKENATKANESADKTISVVKEAIGLN
jgi:tryptophanyl-tRNA synthetase